MDTTLPTTTFSKFASMPFGGLDLLTGDGHGLGKFLIGLAVISTNSSQPFSRKYSLLSSSFLELRQEPDVVVKDQAQVADA